MTALSARATLEPHEVIDRFRDAIASAGLPAPAHIEADGQLHRFTTNGKASDKAGYYCLHLDGLAAGFFGCWRAGHYAAWNAIGGDRLDAEQLAKLRKAMDEAKAEREQRQKARAQVARDIWDAAQPAQDSHPYLKRKGVRVAGEIRQADIDRAAFFDDPAKRGTMRGCLLVKVEGPEGLQSLQAITPEGDSKPFMSGGKIAGGCTILPGDASTVYVVEGVATGLTVHHATGATVAVAFNSGNLPAIAQRMKQEAPGAALVVAADNDHRTEGNPGMVAAEKAAQASGAAIVSPQFGPESSGSDWNDYHTAHGLEAVREALQGREQSREEQVAAALDALDIPEPERPGAFPIPESCKGTFAVRMGLDMARATEMPQATAVITALGAFSGVLSMAFCTGYADGSRLPVGLYTVAEQPPGTAKSRLLNSFATPWLRKVRHYNAERVEEAEAEAEQEEGGKPKKPRLLPLPFSNATPEAMEQAMTQDDTGHFWLQSAEQGAIRMLFGDGVKDRPKNFDLALKGFNGEFHSSARVTRQKLLKEVYGAITVLAQAGSIRTILSNSDGDGLAERFLFVAEPHNLGKRTHDAGPPDPFLRADLEQALGAVMQHYQTIPEDKRGELEDLRYLGFSDTAHEMIRQHKIRIEPKLAQHADNGEMVLTAILSKSDMQAMKLATVMYLSDCLASGKPYAAKVPDEYLTAGLELAMTLVKHIEAVLVSMERIGPEAAREAIRRQFDKRPERTIREIVQNVKKVKPFRDNPSPSAYAKRIITGMVNRGELLQVGNRLQLG